MKTFQRTAVKAIDGVGELSKIPEISLEVSNISFRPDLTEEKAFSRYWGSLSRILQFRISTDSWVVDFVDRARMEWTKEQNRKLEEARQYVAQLIANSPV